MQWSRGAGFRLERTRIEAWPGYCFVFVGWAFYSHSAYFNLRMKNEYTSKLEKVLGTVSVRLASIHGEVAVSNTPQSLLMVKAQNKTV